MSAWTDADLDQYLAEDPEGPVVMLNLLRFNPDGGAEKYQEYVQASRAAGSSAATPIFFGTGGLPLEDGSGPQWDAVALVRSPNQAFVDMVRSPEYQAREHLRTEALAEAVLQPIDALIGG